MVGEYLIYTLSGKPGSIIGWWDREILKAQNWAEMRVAKLEGHRTLKVTQRHRANMYNVTNLKTPTHLIPCTLIYYKRVIIYGKDCRISSQNSKSQEMISKGHEQRMSKCHTGRPTEELRMQLKLWTVNFTQRDAKKESMTRKLSKKYDCAIKGNLVGHQMSRQLLSPRCDM